jgi:hypothetical protein
MAREDMRAVPWRELGQRPADLDEPCSRRIRWRDLIVCGPTAQRLAAKGGSVAEPQQLESWRMLAGLAQEVLDKIVDEFDVGQEPANPLELTYGFSGQALVRRIRGRIAPTLDQHAALELDKHGHRICRRGGAAVDLRLYGLDSDVLLVWLLENIPYDRAYYYGPKFPLHVSWSPEPVRQCWEMIKGPSGRRIPRPISIGERTK